MTHKILVCTNFRPFSGQPSCRFRGSDKLVNFLETEIRERSLDIKVETTLCMGHCVHGPNVRVPGEDFLHHATEETVAALLDGLASDQGNPE